jgi:hypothetical protein
MPLIPDCHDRPSARPGSLAARAGSARRLVAAAALQLVALESVVAPALGAQRDTLKADRRIPRQWLFMTLGALGGAALSSVYVDAPGKQARACAGGKCTILLSLAGGTVGYLTGLQSERLRALRLRGQRPIRIESTAADLSGEPAALAARGSTVAVGGLGGVQLFASDGALEPVGKIASGVQRVTGVDVAPRSGHLVLAAPSGVYLYPQVGAGVLVRDGEASAVAAGADRLFYAAADRVESARLSLDSAAAGPGATLDGPAAALRVDEATGLLWAATDDSLYALRASADSLTVVGRAPLPGTARRLAVARGWAAVALGDSGLVIFDVRDAASPKRVLVVTSPRFVYDVALDEGRLFAAAGVEGVYVFDLRGARPRAVGLARNLGFATAIASSDGRTYLIDRSNAVLRRFPSNF